MFLKSIQIENFQQYQEIFALKELSQGLNIVCGNNEAGKSTLLRALRAILFDRFTGKAGEDYASYRGGVPEVMITFSFQDKDYKLEKIFSKKKEGRCVLTDNNGKQWIAAEAETYLASLLRFDSIDRGLAKPEQQGIYGVLWVEQGRASEQVKLSDNINASQVIQDMLGRELTDMLSQGKGEALLTVFSTDLKQYQTEKTNKPSGDLKAKIEAIEDATTKLTYLNDELKSYQDKVDHLANHIEERRLLIENNVEQEDKIKLESAKNDLRSIENLNEEYVRSKQNLDLMQARFEAAHAKYQERIRLIELLQKEKLSLDFNSDKIEEIKSDLLKYQSDLLESKAELSKAKELSGKARATLEKARAFRELVKLQKNIQQITEQLEQADRLQIELADYQEKLAQIRIDSLGISSIKEANREVDTLKIKLDSIATKLRFTIDAAEDNNVFLNDKKLSGKGEQLIAEASELKFGMNKIAIIPGGDELETLHLNLNNATTKLSSLFFSNNVSSIDEADMQINNRITLASEIKSLKNQIKIIAPDGIEQLKETLSKNKGEEKSLQVKIGQEPTSSVEDADSLVKEAESELEESQKKERILHDQLIAKQEEARQIDAQLSQAAQLVKAIDLQLISGRKNVTDDQLKNQELGFTNIVNEEALKLHGLDVSLQGVDLEGAQLEVDRRVKALQNTQLKLAKITQNIHDLELALVASGQRGLAEEKEQAEQRLNKETSDFERLSQHAGSLNLLCKVIKDEIQKAKELVVKPLTEAMKPYLKILFPDSNPIINENFCLQNILRNGIQESFENLSMGTREQLAILIRLAYADILADNGSPAMIVLDDALVNTDDNRREKMKQILYRASQKYQIILLTCHGNSYRDCGGSIHEIN